VVIAVAVSAAALLFVGWKPLRFGIPVAAFLALTFTFWFFRDPERTTPAGDNLVVAPADGRVVLIAPVEESEYLKGRAIQVSIFMSPLDVHVNRFPISGTICYFRHIPGEYLVAYEEKSSLRNERTHIGIENGRMKVLFKQIAGFVARRIVAEVKEGDRATAGRRFGMIKFGSRVDVLVPGNATVSVRVGERTVAGETVLAVAP
jgi:phosphatidylserine decarboxylase